MSARGLAVGAIAVATIVVAVGCAASPAISPALTPGPMQWERFDAVPDSVGGPTRVVPFGGRFLGVGGTAWTSVDGITWTPLELPPGTGEAGQVVANGIATDGDLVVIVGAVGDLCTTWASSDGIAWQTASDPDLGPPPGFPKASQSFVAVGPQGVVAAGEALGGEQQRPVTWFSRDGLTWSRNAPLMSDGSRSLVAVPDGFVLAVAGNKRGNEFTRAAFWTSRDGQTWTESAEDPTFGNAEPHALAPTATGLVAVGSRGMAGGPLVPGGLFAPMAWTSADGRAWVPAANAPAMAWWTAPGPTPVTGEGAIQGTVMSGVVAMPDGLLAVGMRWGLDPSTAPDAQGQRPLVIDGALWRSDDGTEWEKLPDGAVSLGRARSGGLSYSLVGAVAVGDSVLVYGVAPEFGGTVWRGTPSP